MIECSKGIRLIGEARPGSGCMITRAGEDFCCLSTPLEHRTSYPPGSVSSFSVSCTFLPSPNALLMLVEAPVCFLTPIHQIISRTNTRASTDTVL